MSTQDSQIVKKEEEYEEKYLKYKTKYNNLKIFLQKGGVDYPWAINSNLLYIALVISPNSVAGREIDTRTNRTIGSTAFINHGNGRLQSPHISLLQINVPVATNITQPLDNFIGQNRNLVHNIIQLSFQLSLNGISIHSERGVGYSQLGPFITRLYNDNTRGLYNNVRQLQTAFRIAIESFLLRELHQTPINIQQNIPINRSIPLPPLGHTPSPHTHYSVGGGYPNSAMSINDYSTTGWQPHISLFRVAAAAPQTLIRNFQLNDNGGNMSHINFWAPGTQINGHTGSLSHIYVEYNRIPHWIPL